MRSSGLPGLSSPRASASIRVVPRPRRASAIEAITSVASASSFNRTRGSAMVIESSPKRCGSRSAKIR